MLGVSRAVVVLCAIGLATCDKTPTAPTVDGFTLLAVADGRRSTRVLISGDTAFSPTVDGRFVATSVATGRTFWSTIVPTTALSDWFTIDMQMNDADVLVGRGADIVAIARNGGAIRWRYTGTSQATLGYLAVATDGRRVAFAQRDGLATVLNAATGAVEWQRQIVPYDSLTSFTTPLWFGESLVYLRRRNSSSAANGEVIAVAVRAADGSPLWTATTDSSRGLRTYGGFAGVVVDGDVVMSLQDGTMLRLDGSTGSVKWVTAAPTPNVGDLRPLARDGSEILAVSQNTPSRIQSLDARTGAVNWTALSPVGAPVWQIAVNSRQIAFSAGGGQLAVLDRQTREFRTVSYEAFPMKGELTYFASSPSFAGSLLVVPSSNGLLTLRGP